MIFVYRTRRLYAFFLLPGLIALFSCTGGEAFEGTAQGTGGTSNDGASVMMPDFLLRDVNQASSSFDSLLSQGDFSGAVTAWYFMNTG